jgi:hypothetical protein
MSIKFVILTSLEGFTAYLSKKFPAFYDIEYS